MRGVIHYMSQIAQQLELITEQYYNEIYKYCRRRVKTDDIAYDITQNVFLALSERYATIDQQKIRQWLYTTAQNKLADYYRELEKIRENMTDVPLSDITEEAYGLTYEPFHEIDDEEIETLAKQIIDQLNPDEQELYIERYVKKTSYSVLAENYSVPEQNMRKRVSRLRKKIKQIICKMLSMIISLLT